MDQLFYYLQISVFVLYICVNILVRNARIFGSLCNMNRIYIYNHININYIFLILVIYE